MAWSDSLAVQYQATTKGFGLVRLANWTTLFIEGADRASFLHNMCGNDVRGLQPGGQCEAFLTDVKGKVVGHVVVLSHADALVLVTVPGQAAKLIAHLERYIIREDVKLTDASPLIGWSVAVGPAASGALKSLPDGQSLRMSDSGLFRAPCHQIWPGGYWVGAATDAELNLGRAVECDDPVWHALRIESGWPLFGVDFDGSNLPQEVGRDAQAISFNKGCYLGQETIARIDALGHVNKRQATVLLDAEAPVGAELIAGGQPVGALTSVAWSPKLDAWLGFAMLRRGHNEPGAKLECLNRPAEVVPTPAVGRSVI